MKDNAIRLNLEDNYRIVAISDIHGHLEVFENLLEKCELAPEDHLIIIGDFINKGPRSLETLHKMQSLTKRPNTYILKGNHEFFICHYMYGGRNGDQFLDYLRREPFRTIIHDTVEDGGFDLMTCKDVKTLIEWSMTKYGEDYDFINTLPVVLFADDLVFVHGGYDKDFDPAVNENEMLKFDDYNRLSSVNDQKVIVGHWPTANLRHDTNNNTPYFNWEKNIITIDGGMGVTSSGELNALIIEKKHGHQSISFLQENQFETVTVIAEHRFQKEERTFINYPHFDIEVLAKGDDMSLCRHIQSGKELTIFNALLEEVDGRPQVITTYINHFLNLPVGESVELVMVYDDCALVKHDGEFGWLWTNQLFEQ